MRRFSSHFGTVTLTDERREHILAFHPDISSCLRYFQATLAEPEKIVRSIHDPAVVICYKFLAKRKKWLAIVVKKTRQPFIVTAYLAKKPKKDRL